MDGRSTTIVLALAIVGTGLAGCIENPEEWFSNTSAEVSAFENKALADEAAAAWQEDAVLVGSMAFELSESPDPRIDADPDPGNGLAPAWWYVYFDPDADDDDLALRAFKVASDGTVTSEADAEAMAMGFGHEGLEELEGWSVDSNAAIATAKTDESFATVAQGYNATIVQGVAHQEGLTAWWVSAMSADGFVVASVDATTGELLEVESLDMDFEMPEFEWGAANPEMMAEPVHLEGAGEAEPGAEPAEFPFTIEAPMTGAIMLEASDSPGESVWWEILDAEGETVDGGSVGGFMSFGSERGYAHELKIEEAGDYTLVVGAGSWVPPTPISRSIEYAFMLDLYPEGMESEHEEHDR